MFGYFEAKLARQLAQTTGPSCSADSPDKQAALSPEPYDQFRGLFLSDISLSYIYTRYLILYLILYLVSDHFLISSNFKKKY